MAVGNRDRWLALGLLVAALGVAYLVLVHPWWTVPMQAESDRIQAMQERELRARMQLGQAPQIEQALAQARQAQAGRPGFLPESNVQLATAGLIQRLETAVEQASPGNRACAIQSRSPLTEPMTQRYPRVGVQVRLRCGVPETSAVLHSLESGTPRLFIDNLNILAQTRLAVSRRGTQSSGGGLDVNFDLIGYLRPAPAGPGQPAGANRAR